MSSFWMFEAFIDLLRSLLMMSYLFYGSTVSALALEVLQSEQKNIKECEQKLCTIILGKKREGDDLYCILSKTWDRDAIKKGETKSIEWGFGDARCSINLNLSRSEIVTALTKKEFTSKIPLHGVKCVVELNGEEKTISTNVAPKLFFREGKLVKIWINLSDLEGPTAITSFVWMISQLEDTLGIFHNSIIKSVNKFIHQRCSKNYSEDGTPKSINKSP